MARGRGELTPDEIRIRKDISDKLNYLLVLNNKKQIDIHKHTGIPKSTLTGYFKGTSTPNGGNVQKLADFFNVKKSDIDPRYSSKLHSNSKKTTSSIETIYSKLPPIEQEKAYVFIEDLVFEQYETTDPNISEIEAYRRRKAKQQPIRQYPYFGAVGAGLGEALQEEKPEMIPLPERIIPPESDFCLLVNGDSMEPVYLNGTYIFVDRTHGIHTGTVAVVILNGEGLIKRVWFENNIARLESFNAKYEDMIVTEDDEFRIIGKVVM